MTDRERALRTDEQRGGTDVPPPADGASRDRLVHRAAAGARTRYLSACAGVGGFDLAADRLGWECVGQIEIADFPTRVLERRFPGVLRHRDLKAYRGTRGEADVLVGGTPCQDWSVAGNRAGLAGERSGLFFDFARIADEIAPRVVVWENVPGVLSACSCAECRPTDGPASLLPGHKGNDFAIVLDEITGLCPAPPADGWRSAGVCAGPKRTAVWRVLDSRYAGVAQRRRRVFLVASPRAECAVALLAEPAGGAGDIAAGGEAREDVAGTLEGGPGVRGWRVGADEAGGAYPSRSARRSAGRTTRTA